MSTGRKRWQQGLAVGAVSGLLLVAAGCKNGQVGQQAPIVDGNAGTDPSMANMANPNTVYAPAPASGYAPVTSGVRRTTSRTAAPITRVAGQAYDAQNGAYAENYPQNDSQDPQAYGQYQQTYDPNATGENDQLYSELLDPNTPEANQPPPPLPLYEQPPSPGPDYLWTPGYWDYAPTGYYYVPGNWVSAPFVGALWTPGWWGHSGGGYRWHHGYWGRHTGFYGGINYGFGYIGFGYQGGYWNNDHFYYNREVNHLRPEVVNNYVYDRRVTVVNNTYINNSRVSYFGGPGGLQRRATPAEFAAVREVHMNALPGQIAQRQEASQNRAQFFAANNGRPNTLFANRPVAQQNVQVPAQLQQNRGAQGNAAFGNRQGGPGMQQPGQAGANFNRPGAVNGLQMQGQQQRMQAEQQRQQQQQALRGNEQQQRMQAGQQQQQFRNNEQQQRMQASQQQQAVRQQQDAQRQQVQQQQRAQMDQQRQQQQQQRVQQDQQRQQQQAMRQQQDVQRQQVQQQQRAQMDQQRQQQQQQRVQQDQQRQQQQAMRQQQDVQRQQVQQQRAQQQQQQVQRQQQSQAQHQAPAQRAPEAPHGNPGGGGHEDHGHH